MEVNVNGNLLNVIIEEEREWSEIFEKNNGKKIRIFVDNGIFDRLFPSWKQCCDKNGILLRIPEEDLTRFKSVKLEFDFDKEGAGEYNIDFIECHEAKYNEDLQNKWIYEMTPEELDYLEEIATLFVHVSPTT